MTRSARRCLVTGALILLIAGAVAWLMRYDVAARDRRLQKSAAMGHCVDAVRDTMRGRLRAAGLSDTASGSIASGARFTRMAGNPEVLSFDSGDVPRRLGRARSSVLTEWQIGGSVSLDGSVPFGSLLATNNGFVCSVIVFDDSTVYVANAQVMRS